MWGGRRSTSSLTLQEVNVVYSTQRRLQSPTLLRSINPFIDGNWRNVGHDEENEEQCTQKVIAIAHRWRFVNTKNLLNIMYDKVRKLWNRHNYTIDKVCYSQMWIQWLWTYIKRLTLQLLSLPSSEAIACTSRRRTTFNDIVLVR
jgi:hypothetical protein